MPTSTLRRASNLDTETTPGQALISAPTRIGFRYDLKTSTDLDLQ